MAIGEFSKYEKKSLTFPNAEDSTEWGKGAVVPCSFDPKVIVFYGGDESRSGTIQYGIFYVDVSAVSGNAIGVGAVRYRSSNGTRTTGSYSMGTNEAASRFKVENNVFYTTRITSGCYFNPSDTYTFEIYG